MTPSAALTRCLGLAMVALACTPDVELLRTATDATTPDARAPRWTLLPSGTASDLRAVWGAAPNDVWAVGDAGTALHWNGAVWSATPTNMGVQLTSVWAVHADEAWAVGNTLDGAPVVLRWDGVRWAPLMSPFRGRTSIRGVWGSGPDGVWVVGAPEVPDPAVARWDGARWMPEFMGGGTRPPDLARIAGSNNSDVWAAGEGPFAFHRAPGGWEPPTMAPRGVTLNGALCVTRDGALWAATTGNAVLRYAASMWTSFTSELTAVRGLWCGQGDNVWAVGEGGRAARWNGSTWSATAVPRPVLTAVWGANNGEAWAVGPRGTIVRYTP